MLCLTVAILLSATERAEPGAEPQAEPEAIGEPHGVFVSDEWRYQHHSLVGGFVKRTLADLVSIPTGLGGWSWADALIAGLATGTAVAFELPLGPSIDVRLEDGLQRKLGPDHLRLWTPM